MKLAKFDLQSSFIDIGQNIQLSIQFRLLGRFFCRNMGVMISDVTQSQLAKGIGVSQSTMQWLIRTRSSWHNCVMEISDVISFLV